MIIYIYIYMDNKTYVLNSFLALILSRDWQFSVVNNPIFVVHADKLCPKHGLLRSLFLYGPSPHSVPNSFVQKHA